MNRIFLSIIKKEFFHIMRDRQTLVIIFVMPLMMLFLYGYAITLEMRNIPTVVIDHDHGPMARDLIRQLEAVDFFTIVARDIPEETITDVFQKRFARCVLVIPAHFSRQTRTRLHTPVQVIIDATDPNAANYINKYLGRIAFNFTLTHNTLFPAAFKTIPRTLYNPDLKSSYFFVPGLVAVILLLISTLLTSIAIVREKEMGTMEQILVSPVRPFQVILGKVIPYVAIGYGISVMILVAARFWFQVPVNGSLLFLNGALILYISTGLSIGLLISSITDKQQIAMMITLMVTILPTVMLSGFIFPIASMPLPFQWVSRLIPATHFLQIIRGVMLKGIGIAELWPQTLILVGMTALLLVISTKKFSSTLD
ncbi:MAG: ABC transporter permease [Calditrichaeota bacterium]|nr:MAG: ABC transporter permease [Calditrichota bacterium]